ncbi:MAG: hypothetical protein ABR592_02230 [Nitriliruptorales bacterium]
MNFLVWRVHVGLLRREVGLLEVLVDRIERRLRRRFDRLVDLEMITWPLLVAAEPKLAELEAEVRGVTPAGSRFCANGVWYGRAGQRSLKQQLMELVGWTHGESVDSAGPAEFDVGQLLTGDELIAEWEQTEPERQQRKAADEATGRGFLWTSEANDVVYDYLYALLPECRECSCLRVS